MWFCPQYLPPLPDVDVINYLAPAIPGPPGPPGPKGDPGPPGSSSGDPIYNTILIDSDYTTEQSDAYIGINSTKPITVTLSEVLEGTVYVIKLEVGAPVGNRKVTISSINGSKIDNKSSVILQKPYDTVTLLFRGNSWHII